MRGKNANNLIAKTRKAQGLPKAEFVAYSSDKSIKATCLDPAKLTFKVDLELTPDEFDMMIYAVSKKAWHDPLKFYEKQTRSFTLLDKWKEGEVKRQMKAQNMSSMTIETKDSYLQTERFKTNSGNLPLIFYSLCSHYDRARSEAKKQKILALLLKMAEPFNELSQVIKSQGPLDDRGSIHTKLNGRDAKDFVLLCDEYTHAKKGVSVYRDDNSYRNPTEDNVDKLINILNRFIIASYNQKYCAYRVDLKPFRSCIIEGGHDHVFVEQGLWSRFGMNTTLPTHQMFNDVLDPNSKLDISPDALKIAKRLKHLF